MQPMGNDKPIPGRPTSPFSAAPPVSSPFLSSGPVVGSEKTAATPLLTPFSSGTQATGYRMPAPPPTRFNGPFTPTQPPSFHPTQDAATYQQTQAPRFPPPSQPATPLRGPPVANSVGSFQPQPQVPTFRMSPPHPPAVQSPPGSNIPPPHFLGPRPGPQSPFQTLSASQASPHFRASPYIAQQGVIPPPPIGPPLGVGSREQMPFPHIGQQHVGGGPMQGLVEEFQSLSVGSIPGSLDSGIDAKSLPRPLDGDEEPRILESYPLNCHLRFLRLTTHTVPSSQSLLARWHLPLGAVVTPLAEVPEGEEVPIVNFGTAGVVRCRRCRTYINPYVTFTDAGRKWRCNLCSLLNDVPAEYYCALDATGRRLDIDQRPELSKGSVEFVAPTEYMVRPPMPPSYFFLIDVSVAAVQSGLLEVVATTIKSCLDGLPGSPRTQIGFLTFDSTLHFHNLKSSLSQPQMMVVADLDDVFLPLPDDLLVNLSDSRHVVDAFLDSLPSMFQNSANVESASGPALKAAFMVMSQLGGKLLVFQSTLPSLGIGRLRLRGDDPRVYGTDKEHTLRIPEDPFYKQMAAEFTKHQIAVDIFAFSEKYSDIASLGSLAKYTGGQVYHYPAFQAATHHEKLRYELARDLRRETAWEAVMRIRCGKGVRFTTYHGHFMLRSTDLLALPAVDCDKSFAMQLSLEDTLMTTQTVYFQVALLYTSSSGERRIRVHTAAAPVVTDLSEMYRQADTGAIVSVLSRLAVENTLSHKLEDARQLMQLKLVKSLKEYRTLYAVQHRLGGRFIFPDSLKFLPLYILSLCKSAALRGGYADVLLDERCATGYSMMILPITRMLKLLYPGLYRIDEILTKGTDNLDESLKPLALTSQCLDARGLYIYDDGFSFVIWLGRMLSPDIVNSILGVDLSSFPDLSRDNNISRRMMRILKALREKNRSSYQLCRIIRQDEQPREGFLLLNNLIEDQTPGSSTFVDWILQIYRQSQSS
ncbi:protein transport protein Sec24-like At3g07100 isoform X2 [Ananas comosus]|uniref:Protein transport protein Sec24-like At3g07100 isoform X2 n=1 Tax=Ananas comosus TaxID=4615 RepID=A0A6P5F6H9_ANACO|nr:protein transport protein Sec24-like At3g07100 isoform X2 [Ananas comosus]